MPVQASQQFPSSDRIFEDECHPVQLASHARRVLQAQCLAGGCQQTGPLKLLDHFVERWRIRERDLANIFAVDRALFRILVQKQQKPDLVERVDPSMRNESVE